MLQSFLNWINAPFADATQISPKTLFLLYGGLILVAILWHMILNLIDDGASEIRG
jgi:hypothetical protein